MVVVGAGQAGLATGYHLRRAGLEAGRGFVLLDAEGSAGGSWQHMWDSLRLFSPAQFSSLPGWPMPTWTGDRGYPPADHVVAYLRTYQERYDLPVHRGVRVLRVEPADDRPGSRLVVHTDAGRWHARVVVSATGQWRSPFVPTYPGAASFAGQQLHTVDYRSPDQLAGRRVLVVGGGNSGAQVVADLHSRTPTSWVTPRPPRFLPDDVDGRVLFDVATRRRQALDSGSPDPGGVGGLGDIVAVPSVRAARAAGALHALPPPSRLTETGVAWDDGSSLDVDTIVWCTGFRPHLRHLAPLHLRRSGGTPVTSGTRAADDPRVHLVGYGDWTSPASATLIGVGRTARDTAAEITAYLARPAPGARGVSKVLRRS